MNPPTESKANSETTSANGWAWVRVADLAETCSGSTPSRAHHEFYAGSIPWVKTGELTDGPITDTEEHITVGALEEGRLRLLPEGTLLIAMYGQGQTRGRTGLLECKATTNQACFAILPNSKFDPSFLQFWFRASYERLRRMTEGRGGNQPNLNGAVLRSELVPLPSIEEQNRIAGRLRKQLTEVARARDAVQAQLDTARALPEAQLRGIFESAEAHGWPRRNLGELLKLRADVVHPRDNPSGPARFVGLEHVESITGRRIGAFEVEMSGLTGRKPRFLRGDIVYGYLRPYLNKVWVAEFDGLCSVDQYVFSVNEQEADNRFVAYFMRSPIYLQRAPIAETPGQLPRIRTDEVASVEINLPSLARQRAIVEDLDREFMQSEELRESLSLKLAAVESLPSALLAAAFRGAM